MRKHIALILALVLTLLLVGCNTATVLNNNSVDTADSTTDTSQNISSETNTDFSSPALPDGAISNDEAIKIALDKAKLSKEDVLGLHCELDYDDIVLKYEVDFSDGKYDYDCEINAESGKILYFEKELDD
ncbi:MAG: PepSY domain-containing protein [Ruminococcus sp.]|nr:PepSY domain-containing protein [Ruminococcus sp.]